jgi:hypothetical protein
MIIASDFTPADGDAWDSIVAGAPEATVFHDRHFLAYHGDRYHATARWVVFRRSGSVIGIMPMAVGVEDGERVARSPYGGSVGGPVIAQAGSWRLHQELAVALVAYLQSASVDRLLLTRAPLAWHPSLDERISLALMAGGFRPLRRELHSLINLRGPKPWGVSARVNRSLTRAQRAGIRLQHAAPLEPFFETLRATFAKHGTVPTHTREELEWLCTHRPKHVGVHVAWHGERPVAGVAEFQVTPSVRQAFYLTQDPAQRHLQGLSWLLHERIERALADGQSWYDLGTSTNHQQPRPSVLEFKESFGAVGQWRETFEWRRGIVSELGQSPET